MNVWQEEFALAGTNADQRESMGPHEDTLGVFAIPVEELATASRMGIPETFLARFFPRVTERIALSRSGEYYNPAQSHLWAPAFHQALGTLARHQDHCLHALRRGLIENLQNIYAAAFYALWVHLTDQASADPAGERVLDSLLDTATTFSAALTGIVGQESLELPIPDLSEIPVSADWRWFRELDSQSAIFHELDFLLHHVIDPSPTITAVVLPMYGSLSLGLAARAVLGALRPERTIPVHLIRLGFHDLAGTGVVDRQGSINVRRLGPAGYLRRLLTDLQGGHVLVIDDNIGYGTTLRAARTLVTRFGGQATTRSVETAWHIFRRSGDHDIADAADLPGLRPNLHHSIHKNLIQQLRQGDAARYVRDPAHTVRGTLLQQMETSYETALGLGTWTMAQLQFMRLELAHAELRLSAARLPAAPAAPLAGRGK